jgi:hypothetical protein
MSRHLLYLARREDFDDLAGRAFVARAERERDRVETVTAASIVDAMLRTAELDLDRLADLKSRSLYAHAFAALASIAKLNEAQIAAITLPTVERLQPFRMAAAFGVIAPRGHVLQPFGLDNLRRIKTPRALAALAGCGAINWKSASLRVRAVFVLRALIGSRRS